VGESACVGVGFHKRNRGRYGESISTIKATGKGYAPQICWAQSRNWSRAFGGEIRCNLCS
jgi:hypothetical protein